MLGTAMRDYGRTPDLVARYEAVAARLPLLLFPLYPLDKYHAIGYYYGINRWRLVYGQAV